MIIEINTVPVQVKTKFGRGYTKWEIGFYLLKSLHNYVSVIASHVLGSMVAVDTHIGFFILYTLCLIF